MKNKTDRDLIIAKRWLPWLRNDDDVAADDTNLGFEKLKADLKDLSPAQLKLVFDLVEQMKMRNKEDKQVGNQNSKYK